MTGEKRTESSACVVCGETEKVVCCLWGLGGFFEVRGDEVVLAMKHAVEDAPPLANVGALKTDA